MITQDNLQEVLEILGFEAKGEFYAKKVGTYEMGVDFTNQKLIYPQGIKIHDTTTSNFSHPENFVVFECVHRLLEKGYKAESLELEPKWQLGREAKSGKADILVRDNKNAPYLIIECKTAQETSKNKSEFSKEWERMQNNGGQLFSYFQQEKATKFLCLYTSDLETESKSIMYQNHIIQAFDNDEYLQEKGLEKSYKKASNNTELFSVWKESYELQFFTQGIFENDVNAYKILETTPTFDKLKELKEDGKYHEFAKILRKHNISGKENAFDKLVNIFLCKIYDESFNKNNLKFGYFGVMADTYASMQDRLMLLYKEAMSEFLGEEITFVSNDDIEKAFKKLHAKDLKAQIKKHIKELKFYSNNDFAFLEVHNKELFLQNAIVLKEIIELFSPYKLTQNSTNQFLGNLFELFLQKGMKQDEGQFFTPIQICEFIMYSLPLDSMLSLASKPLKVLDFACGAGHFLNTYANELKRYIKQDLQEHYKQIYGIEKEYRLSKVAKVSSAMYGQNEINILYADALATHELENPKTDKGNKQKPQINNNSFDLLIANPPYSVKGFLETLSAKSKKTYTLFTNDINIETNNAIECFFIERANQLLRDNAKVAIILPSSILNKDGIYKSTREILFANFDFIAIVELGSGTFGATGTNTIILFLRKKDSFTPENTTISQDYSNIKNYIESGHLSQNEPYKDYINAFNAYCDFMGFDKGEYESFLNGSLESSLADTAPFKEYHAAFKETSDYKKLVESKAYKDSKDKDTLAHNAFLAYARAIEKDKLLYFSLSLNQAPIIIKAPSDNKAQKKFLGYEWSNRKGDEGLKELHSPYLSPLFERDNPHNPNKLAYLIRQEFLEISSPIPQDLSPYAFKAKLIDMLDFSKVDFNKAISLNPTNSQGEFNAQNPFENCKYELVKLGEVVVEIINGSTPLKNIREYWNSNDIHWLTTPDFKENVFIESTSQFVSKKALQDKKVKIVPKESVLLTCTATIGKCAINKIELTTNQQINALICDDSKIINRYLVYILRLSKQTLENSTTNPTVKHINLTTLKNLKIPLPPLEIQTQIVAECEKVEDQYNTIRMSIEKYQELIKAILVKCGIVDSSEGGSRDFIASLLDSIQELESKLDFFANFAVAKHDFATIKINESAKHNLESVVGVGDTQGGGSDFAIQAPPPCEKEKIESKLDTSRSKPFSMTNTNDLKALLDSIPTPPKQGWERVKLSNVCRINEKTYNPSNEADKEYIYIDIDSVEKGTGKFSTNNKLLASNLPTRARRLADDDSVIISTVRPYLKGFAYIKESIKDSIFSTGFAILKGNERLKSKFIYILFMFSNDLMKQMEEKMPKASYPSINADDIKAFQIPLPPLEAQEKIISAIDSVESQIAHIDSKLEMLEKTKAEILANALNANNEREREREQAELKEILKTIESLLSQRAILQRFITKILQKAGLAPSLHTLLASLPTPPKHGWDTIKLGEVCEILIGGTPARNNSAYFQGDNLWVSIAEMNGQVITDTKEKITDEAIKKSNVKLIPKGTTLLSFKLSIGKTAIAGKDLYTNEAIAGLIPNDNNKLLDMFLFYIFKWQTIDLNLKGNNTFGKSLNSSILKQEVKIPLPPLEAQEKIVSAIDSVESQIATLDSRLKSLESKKAQILQEALSDRNERENNS